MLKFLEKVNAPRLAKVIYILGKYIGMTLVLFFVFDWLLTVFFGIYGKYIATVITTFMMVCVVTSKEEELERNILIPYHWGSYEFQRQATSELAKKLKDRPDLVKKILNQ